MLSSSVMQAVQRHTVNSLAFSAVRAAACAGVAPVSLWGGARAYSSTPSVTAVRMAPAAQSRLCGMAASAAHWRRVYGTGSVRRMLSTEASSAAEADGEVDELQVIPILSRIQDIVKTDLEFPRFIVLGNQSSGKTSALEALIGMDILPKGQDMVTRRPLEVTMVRTETGQWVEFDGHEKYFDFDRVKARIREENLSINGVTNEPLRLKVMAPHFHNLTLVDLPGYINAVKPPMPVTVPKQIRDMIQPYIEDPRNIMLVVCSATEDLANSMGLARAQENDPSGRRSMGVVTKCDLPKFQDTLVETLQNRNFPLGLGYIGVRCRTQMELERGMGFDELVEREAAFFETSGLNQYHGVRTGLPLLRRELSATLLRKISAEFPRILAKLDKAIETARRNESFLETLANEPNLQTVAKELESLVNQLHSASHSRREFEEKLRVAIHDLMGSLWETAVRENFDFAGSQLVTESSPQRGHAAVRNNAADLLTAMEIKGAAEVSHFKQLPSLMVHGTAPLVDVTNETLEEFRDRSVAMGALGAYYRPALSDTPGEDHRKWHRDLGRSVDHVLEEQEAVQRCFDLLLDSLREFSETAETHIRDGGKQALARMFFRYLLEKIAARIQSEGLEETITGMIDREKRPYAEFAQVLSQLVAARKHPSSFGWFFDGNKQLRIPLYGRDWTEAYMRTVTSRTGDDIFRILAVRMLEPLIFECIQYSLNLFRAEKIVKEADRQTSYLRELEEYREVLVQAAEKYSSGKTVVVDATN